MSGGKPAKAAAPTDRQTKIAHPQLQGTNGLRRNIINQLAGKLRFAHCHPRTLGAGS